MGHPNFPAIPCLRIETWGTRGALTAGVGGLSLDGEGCGGFLLGCGSTFLFAWRASR